MVLSPIICVAQISPFPINGKYPEANLKIKVLAEDGTPLSAVKVGGAFSINSLEALSNERGEVTLISPSENAAGAYGILDGYYESYSGVSFDGVKWDDPKNPRWLPLLVERTLILRKIGNPVPLFGVENMETEMPKIGTAGFDLEKRDWVAPHGNGIISDLVFTLTRQGDETRGEATLRMSFSHPGDGFVPINQLNPGGSRLRFPREAPDAGYETTWREWHWKWVHGETDEESREWEKLLQEYRKQRAKVDPPVGYFLRLRTVLDKNGEVISARYARLVCDPKRYERRGGDFEWEPDYHTKTTMMKLTYYFNPTGSRNLEFDLKKNLFKDLPDENKPRWP